MFTLDDYKVVFRHEKMEANEFYRGITDCFVFKNDALFNHKYALCSIKDQFSRAIGRKIALARALEPFDKATRTRFWKAYFETQGGVK